MVDRRQSKSRWGKRLRFEALERREMFATDLKVVLSNPGAGEYTSIQAAVNNASPGATITIGATAGQLFFAESVNLSLMGSALPGGATPGNLTFIGDATGGGTTIAPPGTTTANGTAFYNSAPFAGNLTFSNLTLRPAVATAGDDKGIKLTDVTGNVTITNTQILDAVDAAIELINVGGASGTQSRVTMNEITITSNGTAATSVGIRMFETRVLATLDDVAISEAFTGMLVAASGTTATSITMRNVDFDGWSDTIVGDDGLRVTASGNADVNVSIAFCDFQDIPTNSIDALASGNAKLAVTVYENSLFSVTDTTVVRTANEAATKFIAQDTAKMSVTFDHNIFDQLASHVIQINPLGNSLVNVNIFENFMTNVGKVSGQTVSRDAIIITGSATSAATTNARIAANQIFDPAVSAIRVIANGNATYNLGIHDNTVTYSVAPPSGSYGIFVDSTGSAAAIPKVNVASVGNYIDGVTTGIRVLQGSSSFVQMRYEWVQSQSVGSLETYLQNNNNGARIQATVYGELQPYFKVAPGTFTPTLPLRLGDFVWNDTNKNGLQDAGEAAVGGLVFTLTGTETVSGAAITQTVISDSDHGYLFGALLPGTYTVSMTVPPGFDLTGRDRLTPSTTDNDEQFDSDFRQGIREATVTLAAGVDNMDLDVGLVPTNGRVWQNQLNINDVNDDGVIAPIDALQVIIALNSHGSGNLPAPSAARTPTPFVDVNGDGVLAPNDALQVIIRLNSGGSGESGGEATFVPRNLRAVAPSSVTLAPAAAGVSASANSENSSAYFPLEYFYGQQSSQPSNDTDDDTAAVDEYFSLLDS